VEEPTVLVLLPAEAFVSMVQNFKQGSVGGTEKGKETLRSFVTDATARAAGKALSLVIVDQEKRFSAPNPPRRRKQGVADREQAKEKKQRRPEANTGCMVSRVDVEEVRTSCCLSQAGLPLSLNPICSRSGAKCPPDTPFCLGTE